jgi:hypothetical protein
MKHYPLRHIRVDFFMFIKHIHTMVFLMMRKIRMQITINKFKDFSEWWIFLIKIGDRIYELMVSKKWDDRNPYQQLSEKMCMKWLQPLWLWRIKSLQGNLYPTVTVWVFRQHLDKKERAFYSRMQGKHEWLWIYSPNGYTHFTSPLRRYADMIVHRILKAKKRWENVPYDNESLDIILSHVNRRILEVETILNERKWSEIVKRISRRSGWRPRTHDLKEHLKRWAKPDEYYTIPQAIRECIIEDISDDDSRTWQWAIGVILLWNDYGLKEILFRRITQEKHISPWAFLRILSQTRLIIGSGTIFTLYEQTDANFCIANITLPNGKVLSSQKKSWKKWEINEIRGHVRRALMYKVFRHYMQW